MIRADALINKYPWFTGGPGPGAGGDAQRIGLQPRGVSPKGAQGLNAVDARTAALMASGTPWTRSRNIAGGVGYLRRCLDRFGHNVPLAVAAYNAGPEAVARYCTIPPYQETQLFVNNVMGFTGLWCQSGFK